MADKLFCPKCGKTVEQCICEKKPLFGIFIALWLSIIMILSSDACLAEGIDDIYDLCKMGEDAGNSYSPCNVYSEVKVITFRISLSQDKSGKKTYANIK